MACFCTRLELVQGCQLWFTADKARQAARYSGLETTPERTGPHQLKHFHWRVQAFHGHRSRGGDTHKPSTSRSVSAVNNVEPGRECSIRAVKRGCLAHGGVVHMEIIADGPDHHLASVQAHTNLHIKALGPT